MNLHERDSRQVSARASFEKSRNAILERAQTLTLSPAEVSDIDRMVAEFRGRAIRAALRRKASDEIAAEKFDHLLLKRVRAFRSHSMSQESTRAARVLDRCLVAAGWSGAPLYWGHYEYCDAKKDFRERHKEYVS